MGLNLRYCESCEATFEARMGQHHCDDCQTKAATHLAACVSRFYPGTIKPEKLLDINVPPKQWDDFLVALFKYREVTRG